MARNREPVPFSAVVEGMTDEAVLRRLITEHGGRLDRVYGRLGKVHIRQKLHGFKAIGRFQPCVILVDLDRECDCAAALRAKWAIGNAPGVCFRVAVQAMEAWLLADRENIASFLSVAQSRVPRSPESLDNPKESLVSLAQRSRRRSIREGMPPQPRSGRRVGPHYTQMITEFIDDVWNHAAAKRRSESLSRAIDCIADLSTR